MVRIRGGGLGGERWRAVMHFPRREYLRARRQRLDGDGWGATLGWPGEAKCVARFLFMVRNACASPNVAQEKLLAHGDGARHYQTSLPSHASCDRCT